MKTLASIFIICLTLTSSGCAFTGAQKSEESYKERKQKLEREIELLRLERRKLIIQHSLDRIDQLAEEDLTGEDE